VKTTHSSRVREVRVRLFVSPGRLREAVAHYKGTAAKLGGVRASWVFSHLFSDRGWGRGMDFEVGEDRRRR
jgi:hypothetical protein